MGDSKVNPWKWAGGAMSSLVTVAIIYMASTMSTLTTQMAVLQSEVAHLRGEVTSKMSDKYTTSQAISDLKLRDERISALGVRLTGFADRVERLADRITSIESKRWAK